MTSLTTRVTLSALLVLAVFITLTGLALERAFEQSALPAISERLSAQLYLTMAETEIDDEGRLIMPGTMPTARLNLPGSGLYAWILDEQQKTLWHTPSALGFEATPKKTERPFERQKMLDEDYFISAIDVEWEYDSQSLPLRFVVAEDQRAYREEMNRFRHTLWIWLGVMAVLLLLALAALLAWGLRPLRQAAREVSAIEAGQQQQLNRRYPRDLQQLTGNINTLLEHEKGQQRRYRDALADLAHSLKTPLAVLRSQGEEADPKTIDEQITRMDDIIQYQLQRAANAGRSAMSAPVAVSPTLQRLIEGLQKVYHNKGIEVAQHIEDEPLFRGDTGDLMELLGNLLDNAFKWSRSRVIIQARNEGDKLILSIEDDGPGIDEDQKNRIMQRGIRADEATPGHGIGLAMVRDIVNAYEGGLSIEVGDHGGVRITLTLPGPGS